MSKTVVHVPLLEVFIKRLYSHLVLLGTSALLFLVLGCSTTTPTPPPLTAPSVPTTENSPVATSAASTEPAPTAALPQATPNSQGIIIVAQLDPTTQILTIYGTTPGATVMMGGTPLPLPPSPTPTLTPSRTPTEAPTLTPSITPTRRPAPPTTTPIVYSRGALVGKIMFKTTRGGASTFRPNWYMMNQDGSDIKELDHDAAEAFAISLESDAYGIENAEPNGTRRVFGERRCFIGGAGCALYILDSILNADLINSDNDISLGVWFSQRGVLAKDPAWSPVGNYIVFVSNHETPEGCRKSANLFKGTPTQNPTIRRLTEFCARGDVGHPSFNGDGSKVVFWAEDSGLRQLFTIDVGATDDFDQRFAWQTLKQISDGQSQDFDPVWVK